MRDIELAWAWLFAALAALSVLLAFALADAMNAGTYVGAYAGGVVAVGLYLLFAVIEWRRS